MGRTERTERNLPAVKEAQLNTQAPMILASGSEAVASIADKLSKMTPAQRTFLRMRFYYDADAECARAIGVQPQTVRAWKQRKDFMAVYQELLTQPVLHARAELVLLTNKAIHRLGELMDSTAPSVALSAVEKVLKSRDAQLLTNNVKVEADDDGDLYLALIQRLKTRAKVKVMEPAPAVEAVEVVEAEFREVPAAPAEV